ncbi:Heterogeneous nuclear ribonucleoprotein A0 [Microtus ochrogaster]|uniref:Heterogeneous nuclear ribonucleoprotein A0 n=1 Tax=Microtus ochrogaster TaxID=79684 RepID=A0A8J6G5Y3_MICOH|nr:Heterogeneous nuclear ribonucleoprotein A0 [Microtus ochrogaster]
MAASPHAVDGNTVELKRAVSREDSARPGAHAKVKKLFVGGLKGDVAEGDLIEHFSQFGAVEKAEIIADKQSGKKRGFGFVYFQSHDAADKAAVVKFHPIQGHRVEGRIWQSSDQKSELRHLLIRGLVQKTGFAIFLEERRPQGEPEDFSSKFVKLSPQSTVQAQDDEESRRTVTVNPAHMGKAFKVMNELRRYFPTLPVPFEMEPKGKQLLCDVMIVAEDVEIEAHRVVLAACSPYFCAMFTEQLCSPPGALTITPLEQLCSPPEDLTVLSSEQLCHHLGISLSSLQSSCVHHLGLSLSSLRAAVLTT